LERRVGRQGKDVVDHPVGGHEDLANACAGSVLLALRDAEDIICGPGGDAKQPLWTPPDRDVPEPPPGFAMPAL
jgi:hypothetical protein